MLPSSYESGPGEAVGGCGARQLFGHSTVVTSSAWPLQNDSVAWNLIVRAQNGGVYANSKCGAVLLVMVSGPRMTPPGTTIPSLPTSASTRTVRVALVMPGASVCVTPSLMSPVVASSS